MSANFWIEEDVCDVCGGPIDVLVKQGYAKGGRPQPAVAQSATCRRGCSGEILPARRLAGRRA
jgi:hypothetical protein